MSVEPAANPAATASSGLAGAPAWVRKGSPELQRDYALGLEFEKMLAQQLAGSLTATAGLGEGEGSPEGEGGAGAPAMPGAGVLSTMLSGALADGTSAAGGLGLAAEIARDMQSRTGATSAGARETGGTSS